MAEKCAGCKATAKSHPIAGLSVKKGKIASSPVCAACHADPAHRKSVLKMAFFPRAQEAEAIRAAELTLAQSKAGGSIGIGG